MMNAVYCPYTIVPINGVITMFMSEISAAHNLITPLSVSLKGRDSLGSKYGGGRRLLYADNNRN